MPAPATTIDNAKIIDAILYVVTVNRLQMAVEATPESTFLLNVHYPT
jgi:hypothetical protein